MFWTGLSSYVCYIPFHKDKTAGSDLVDLRSFSLATAAKIALVIISLAPMLGALGWHVWDVHIRPRFISDEYYRLLAQAMIRQFGDEAGYMAYVMEDRAWRRSESYEQACWRRIRRIIAETEG